MHGQGSHPNGLVAPKTWSLARMAIIGQDKVIWASCQVLCASHFHEDMPLMG